MFKFSHAQEALRNRITEAYRADEAKAVQWLLAQQPLNEDEKVTIAKQAKELILKVRENRKKASGVDALMHEFTLSTEEGIALMCLAEALLRIPDVETRNKLIQDKISGGDWKKHLGHSPSLFVNSTAWGLFITGKLTSSLSENSLSSALTRVVAKGGQPLIRLAVNHAMRLLGKQFVTGETIEEALKNGAAREKMGYRFSFDMLGEAAMTSEDAQRYYQDYVKAIHAIGKQSAGKGVYDGNGISVKLSAIHPRYSRAKHERVMTELLPRLKELFLLAKQYDIGLNIDAEEANRLELSLDLIESLIKDPDLKGFKGIGIVVQAYQKRCPYVIDYLVDVARRHGQKLMIRLVKGAYWDSEIKWSQLEGLEGYPVYTRKAHTDVSYLVCARKLLAAQDAVFPQFATHNAYTACAIYHMGKGLDFEFQCLHGMGETLYDQVVGEKNLGRRVRVYAPVGTHETLLAYLVRRLLENGANSSFVNQLVDEKVSIDDLVKCPLDVAETYQGKMHQALPLPRKLYGSARDNSLGIDLSNELALAQLEQAMNAFEPHYVASSLLAVADEQAKTVEVLNPANHDDKVGQATFSDVKVVSKVIEAAIAGQTAWASKPVKERADCLRRFADLMEEHMPSLMALAIREAGKTLTNAIAEIREAVDFCRYYADEAEHHLPADAQAVGAVVTISPWNFPLAIFIGQTVAALVVGNSVVAKPAEQTSLIAHRAVTLLHQAGVPTTALQLILGAGDVGAALTSDARIAGVIFTGSTEVAKLINKNLKARDDQPLLIAETGGQNAMIVDSTALPEQVCVDVLNSAFDSAGQRCSALRILCVQEEVADRTLKMIKDAMNELKVGNPVDMDTDIGPVIDAEAQKNLNDHIQHISKVAKNVHQIKMQDTLESKGTYVLPTLIELNNLNELKKEVFGPVLHVIRYRSEDLLNLIDQINAKGYALTHGVHSRIDATVAQIIDRVNAGNIYVNRNIVGAVVGVQPFGGHGLSGTGPKAGGPFYLQRLINTKQWRKPLVTTEAVFDQKAADALIHSLNQNANIQNKAYLQEAVNQAKAYHLHGAVATLKGPTGEENTLHWELPKGIWLYGGDLEQALKVAVQLQVLGFKFFVLPDHPVAQYSSVFSGLTVTEHSLILSNVSHVLSLGSFPSAERLRLADSQGAIVHLIETQQEVDYLRLYQEVSVSINTTAAGGNASLMAMSEA
ncbi:bifunctional proline dehydrogenase/L-glutamate gamma-semialdehyde dehydrogenase PutA [Basilea psittacipulmonis]|uniref:Bifunctional protein PutA n=1 Tax=Basilea psittacipulmonis DSM 24701 TaxID=1072685 RepID=A0A077DDU7_9BURK|nr:bifunctional proline dehydrogenase/L-glutamate gamma-semialdehyde dehydrogenase PutA [Basilea psittacipulmonis]AIL32301.1 proline dehydrogenase [Basilea psittacipulmonis DSM 24701]